MATLRAGREDQSEDPRVVNTGKTYFLGIGIDQYQAWPRLRNAVRDVQAVREVLINDFGLQTENAYSLYDGEASRSGVIQALEDMADRVTNSDSLLVYYAGHGHLNDRKRGYWVPANAPKDDISYYIPNSTIRDYLRDINSLHTLLISDACFSGSLFVRGERSGDLAAHELSKLSSRWAICSGRHDEVVADGPSDGHSPFAESILDVLQKTERSLITTNFLFEQVREQTRANYDQLPDGGPIQGVGHKRGQYIFKRSKKESAVWAEAQAQNTAEAYRYYLGLFPMGEHADEANAKLQGTTTPSPNVTEPAPTMAPPPKVVVTVETPRKTQAATGRPNTNQDEGRKMVKPIWIIGGLLLALAVVLGISKSFSSGTTNALKKKEASIKQELYRAMRNRDATKVQQLEKEYRALPDEITEGLPLNRADQWMTRFRDSLSRAQIPTPTEEAESSSSKTRYLVHSDFFKSKGEAAEVLNEMQQTGLNQLEIIELRPNRFVVKVGVLDDRIDAQKFVSQLEVKGFATYIKEQK